MQLAAQNPQQKPHTGLFNKAQTPKVDLKPFSDEVNNLSGRMRLLEERFTNMRQALQIIEQNMLGKNKVFSTEIRTLTSDLSDIKKDLSEVKDKIVDLVKELRLSAKKEEVKVLEKYLNYWNPVKFVTQNEVEELVQEIMKKERLKNTTIKK